jgi:hypothetical protein
MQSVVFIIFPFRRWAHGKIQKQTACSLSGTGGPTTPTNPIFRCISTEALKQQRLRRQSFKVVQIKNRQSDQPIGGFESKQLLA